MLDKLTEKDKGELFTSFISIEMAKLAGLRRVDSVTGANLIGRTPNAREDISGIVFTYRLPEDENPRDYRIRRDNPPTDSKGKIKDKYLASVGAKPKFYFPSGVTLEMLRDVELPIIITEGEKKGLALWRVATDDLSSSPRFLPLALQGVNNWIEHHKNEKREMGDFHLITWTDRKVTILFDADKFENYQVAQAETRLAKHLKTKQSRVFICSMPKVEGYKGIDDLLGFWDRENSTETAVKNCLELLETAKEFEPNKYYLSNDLSLAVSDGERNKTKVFLFREALILNHDQLLLSKGEDRKKFTKDLDLSDPEKTEINQLLMQLSLIKPQTQIETKSVKTIQTSFEVLKDGRIIEQIRNGFAVFNPESGDYCILDSVTDSDGICYEPIDDEIFQKAGGLQLANELTEYGSEKELIAEIENYLSTYLDLKPLFLKLTALYILFTYIFDCVLELSYLNATGDPGSGKSRFGSTVCFASHRGLALITPSAASLYRIVDKFKPTLFIDEFNSDAKSDDAAAVIQILNAGFQQTAQIPRQVATGDGQFKTEMFDPYCPKIIGSLKQSASNAFNSRCIEIQMERTTRNDIPLRLSRKHLQDSQNLRNKLTLWRLRNFQNDFEAKLNRAETELQNCGIIPRSIQINIPLFALINDDVLKRDFINLLKGRDVVLAEEKRNSIDGELVQMLHHILFDVDEDGTAKWCIERPRENVLCEDLRIERIVSMMNHERKEKEQLNSRYIGKKLSGLGLRAAQILTRKSEYHKKSAVYFDSHRLGVIFRNYGLPIPLDFSLDQLDQNGKSKQSNDLNWSKEDFPESTTESSLDQSNSNDYNSNEDWSNWSKEFLEKDGLKENNGFENTNRKTVKL
jgi:hypothetical protein